MNTIEGKQQYLFLAEENVFELLASDVRESDIYNWELMSKYRTGICKHCAGSEYLTLVCPEKAAAYARMLPEGYPISDSRPAKVISPILGARMFYPVDLLAWTAAEHVTYGASESHWNDYGAYAVYRDLIGLLSNLKGRTIPVFLNPEFILKEGGGYCDIGPTHERVTWIPHDTKGRCVFDNAVFARGNVKVCLNSDSTLPTLVLFRDSFANMLLPFLMESFSRIVAISSWHPIIEVIVAEKPDFVICQIAERYMIPSSYVDFPNFHGLCKMNLGDLIKKM